MIPQKVSFRCPPPTQCSASCMMESLCKQFLQSTSRHLTPARISHITKWDKICENDHKIGQKEPLWLKEKGKSAIFLSHFQ
jgi:hypothetical protein